MIKERISLVWLFILLVSPFIFSVIGISLPNTINFINGFDGDAFYGHFASYALSMMLFYFTMMSIRIKVKRESYFVLLERFCKKYLVNSKPKKKSKGRKN